ncbi:50S ribosomal protein L9 [Silanimonas sp.]|uniref:50S ribosomal protein L9 n=1 Tax=Silanimonas sp. TaxID=1929290 RepID=UPI001BBD3127|nr:50S ribosomal protein L9 [Silanimonas sp.]MBS3896079.1 50S ribosomal protein L9 [Silanimonas sp.]MBS3923668.1 50S ribosomal protein L9 [Xanthomonadaceae bacterium]
MELILLQKVVNLGGLGDKVRVKPGYGRNYLIPYGKAVPATAANIAAFEARRAEYEAKAKALLSGAEGRKARLDGVAVTLAANASPEGKLYGSVTARDIAEALSAAGHPVQKAEILLTAPIRALGEYEVTVHLHAEVEATVKVQVKAEA